MTYTYYPHRSQIIDVFFAPALLLEKEESDLTQKEQGILADVLLLKEDIKQQLQPLKEQIDRYYLLGEVFALPHELYTELLRQGKDPQTVAETLTLFEEMTDQAITTAYRSAMSRSYIETKPEDLLDYLDRLDLSAEAKWHWFQAIRNPKATVAGLVELLRAVDQIYQPYYERFAQERETYMADFSLERLLALLPVTDKEQLHQQVSSRPREVYLLSPYKNGFIVSMGDDDEEDLDSPIRFLLSTRMEQLMAVKDQLDMDDFSNLLKTLSDESRYRVLQALTKGTKNKDIAEKMGITGAAVSFHTQKLINANLLLVDSDNKGSKYKVNQGLLNQVTKKLVSDFDLTGQQTGPVTKQMSFRMEKEMEQNDNRTSGDSQQDTHRTAMEFTGQVFEQMDEAYNQIDRQLKDTGFEGMIKSIVKNALNKGSQAMRQYASSSETGDGFDFEKNGFAFQFKTGDKTNYENRYDLEDELEEVTEELADLEEDIEDLNNEMANLTEDLDELYNKWQSLQARKKNLEEERERFLKK